MLGRLGVIVPLFIMYSAGPWFGLSVYNERSTQMSSMQPATLGSNSLTATPLSPYC